MGLLAIIAIAQVGAGSIAAYTSTAAIEEPSPAVRACISTNAPQVERAVESLTEATDFLVQKVCLGPIAEQSVETARKDAQAEKERMETLCKDTSSATATDPGSRPGSFARSRMCDPDMLAFNSSPMSDVSTYLFLGSGSSSAKTTSLAAQTLLQLRIARTKPR
jgi:hypothetical protein